jgi:hypothetical protein
LGLLHRRLESVRSGIEIKWLTDAFFEVVGCHFVVFLSLVNFGELSEHVCVPFAFSTIEFLVNFKNLITVSMWLLIQCSNWPRIALNRMEKPFLALGNFTSS